MTGTNCDLFTHKSFWSYLNHLVHAEFYSEIFQMRDYFVDLGIRERVIFKCNFNKKVFYVIKLDPGGLEYHPVYVIMNVWVP
jgi:hypothetical protein